MGKYVFGGNKHKGMARKSFGVRGGNKMRTIEEEGEIYAVVVKIQGGSRCLVLCMDDQERDCVIRGKFRGGKKRDNVINAGTLVLVGAREWSSASGEKRPICDLLEVYSDGDKERLKKEEVDIDWGFTTSYDGYRAYDPAIFKEYKDKGDKGDNKTQVKQEDDIVFAKDDTNEEYERQIKEDLAKSNTSRRIELDDMEEVDVDDI